MKSLFTAIFAFFSLAMHAYNAPADTLVNVSSQFRPQQLVFPAAAIALGGAGVNSHLVDTSKPRTRRFFFDDMTQYVPITAYAALGFIPGVRHEHNFGERFLAGATAYIVMTGLAQGVKHVVREPRPDSATRNSFPSGHTATAFCGAELCRMEYGNAYGAAAYAFAVTTGVMRVVNNRHWCNDVLAGAGVGFLSAHVGYWLLPFEQRVINTVMQKKKAKSLKNNGCGDVVCNPSVGTFTSAVFVPSYDYETKSPLLSFSMSF